MTSPAPADLSASDRLMWRIEEDPVLRSPIMVVGLLDRAPDWEMVRTTMGRSTERVPRLRQTIERSGPGGRGLRWRDAPNFAIDYHLRRLRAPFPGTLRSVLELAEPWVAASLDPARPQWECTIVEGLEGDRGAFVLKFHHTISDGVGGVDLAESVFDVDRSGTAPPAAPPAAPQPAEATTRGAPSGPGPAGAARLALRTIRSVGRMLRPAPEELSPLLHGRGLDRRLDVLAIPMEHLTVNAHALGLTVNDLFLAAVAGGLHDYHERYGLHVPALRITMPINVRREGDPPGGNHFTPARFVLPIDDPDPRRRASIAGAIAHRWRAEPAVGLTQFLAAGLDLLPSGIVTALFGSMLKHVDVDAVDVPGLHRDAFLGGGRLERMWAFAPPTGAALSVTLLSHAGTACIGTVSDLAAVTDPDLLQDCLRTAFEQWADTPPAAPVTVAAS